ncbi:amino acid transporter [Rhodobacteraceae bacterium 2CG4]|uniref:Amino acid transporter n=1 Tax=Halovulum marinum TaxID=2662447 RepID=A0A6L5Z074_9RHOB|nr:LysE/ArgO family amino acid transporter [Halovulum marinum]MSU89943.1 amino acid transporter [Halovulum marinum]
MTGAAATGFASAFALILAIGAQNAFVLRQGLLRAHVFWICLVCALSDAVLIAAGIAGFGALVGAAPWLPRAMALAGAAFLLVYGALRARAALAGGHAIDDATATQSLRAALLTCLTFTWLNPHVYLDTLALLGAISTAFEGAARLAFGLGAVSASFVFFFGLGYGARLLAPLMRSPRAWRWLDGAIALVMWALAGGLLASA